MPRLRPCLLAAALAVLPSTASAAEALAKEVARNSNCKPGKIEVLKQTTGTNGETTYKIACTDRKDLEILVRCMQRTCLLLR